MSEPLDGNVKHEVEVFIEHLLRGDEAEIYDRRFGHFGPKGMVFREDYPEPRPPMELEPLDFPEDEPLC